VGAACNYTRVKLTDPVVPRIHSYAYFNQIRNLCYSYTHLRVFAKQKATSNLYSKYATLDVRHKH